MAKCANCGFVAVRVIKTRELAEVDDELRKSWHLPVIGGNAIHYPSPVCSVGAASLPEEIGSENGQVADTRVDHCLHTERGCDRFTPYLQTFSPKEHKEMMHAEELRRINEESKARDRVWQAEQKRWDRGWSMVLVLVAALVGYVFGKGQVPSQAKEQVIRIEWPDVTKPSPKN